MPGDIYSGGSLQLFLYNSLLPLALTLHLQQATLSINGNKDICSLVVHSYMDPLASSDEMNLRSKMSLHELDSC